MTIDNGQVQIDVIIDSIVVLTKYFSISKSRAGVDGSGATAKLLRLSSTSQIFHYNGENEPDPPGQEIIFTADAQNLDSSSVAWSVKDEDGVDIGNNLLTITGNQATLTIADFGSNYKMTVTVISDNITDQVTVYRLVDGSDTITAFLTNEAHVVDTDSDGNGGDYSGANTDI